MPIVQLLYKDVDKDSAEGGNMMRKMYKNMGLPVSIGAILLFILTIGAYMKDSPIPYLGPWPLILISGAVIVTLGTAMVFSVVTLWKYKFYWQGLTTILLNAITLPPIGYAFLIWMIVTIA